MKRPNQPTSVVGYSFTLKILSKGLFLVLLSSCLGQDSNKKNTVPQAESFTPSQTDDTQREPKDPPAQNPPPVIHEPSSGSDPLYAQAWHLQSTGLTGAFATSQALVGEDLNVHNLHQQGVQGNGVRIAISDNGVEINHPDLIARQIPGESRNYTSTNSSQWRGRDPYPTSSGEVAAHGTAVAGLAVASGFNNIGSRGVAPRAQFAGFNFVGAGTETTISQLLDQATGNFDLFNYSYGRDSCAFTQLPSSYHDQLRLGAMNLRQGRGVLYVKAAGNEYLARRSNCLSGLSGNYAGNANLESDNNEPWTVVVGATDPRGYAAFYSTPGSSLWISAPGGDTGTQIPALLTTDLTGCDKGFGDSENGLTSFDRGENGLNSNCDYTSSMNGTSGATPLVTGGLALVLSVNPQLNWRELKYVIAKTARKIDSGPRQLTHPQGFNLENHIYMRHWITNAAGFHFHNWYGFGVLDAQRAVHYVRNHEINLGAWTQAQHSSGTLSLGIPDNLASGVSHSLRVNQDLIVEAIQVRLNITHDYPGDLGVELRSPSGTLSTLMAINSGMVGTDLNNVLLSSNAFFFEQAQGDWQIRVIDGASEDIGVLTRWELIISGHENGSATLSPKSIAVEETAISRQLTSVDINQVNLKSQNITVGSNKALTEKAAQGSLTTLQETRPRQLQQNKISILAQKEELLIDKPEAQKRLKEVIKLGEQRALLYTDDSGQQAEIIMIHADASQEVIILDFLKDARWLEGLRSSKEDSALIFLSANQIIKVEFKDNSWQEEVYQLQDQTLGQAGDRIITWRETENQEQEIVVHDTKSLRIYRVEDDQKVRLNKAVELTGEFGRSITIASQQVYPLSHENTLTLYTLSEGLEEIARFRFPRKIGKVHLYQGEKSTSFIAIMEMLGAGFWEKFGSYQLNVVELDLFTQDFEIKKTFETQGEDHLRDSHQVGEIISVLGTTRGDFADQNFGDLDLTVFSVNLKGEMQEKIQWGRKQKRIDSSGDEWGIRLFDEQGFLEIWAESTGPILGAPLEAGWRSFMLRPGGDNEI